MKPLLCIVALLFSSQVLSAQWIKQTVNTTASFRGLSVVNEKVIWASGTGGTVIRTIDGGRKWDVIQVPDAAKLDFRDIEAFDANTAYILSIGNGESSRIYKTTDGGKTWNLQFKNTNEKAFFDAIACWDNESCIAVSDPVDGKYIFIRNYGGDSWSAIETPVPALAKDGQAAFAASGTCLITTSIHHAAMLVTGGTASEVLTTNSNGAAWETSQTPIITGTSGSGIFSIDMFYGSAVIVGGNYEKPDEAKDNLAFSTDGGKTWKLGTGLTGYRSGVTYVDKKTIIAVGTNGTDITRDGGKTWKILGKEDLNAVAAKGKKAVWAVGPKGMVVKMK
ncbi:MAG: hypothetical protein WBC19_00760 [Pyrinomonadaceae bacterium]|nr:hypothetical protein [Chloracidobacterium sp.]